ncbi:CapA family protein [Cohnella lupini]|uniref:Poly-gamma-glutamate synthesis protein (Capsule biosynthesis protein) n=1 Tax=Cohnella lupini TaxID=1294267 RepID=A0A3D9IGU0_9BACL|nr:CapA family protein [Cohnella lupini]RED60366.1 poly-gamma-glutamate synthesis protein (capsule biosynthesis protein) [Cohnella lupini]
MKRPTSWLNTGLCIGLLAILLTACSNGTPDDSPLTATSIPDETRSPDVSTRPPTPPETASSDFAPSVPAEPERSEATLLAVGDIMVHMPQLPAYYDRANNSYDLTGWFTQVKPILGQGDWVIGNLETPIAGREFKYTGYPRFNAPRELADALVSAGVQLVSTANNHSMDRAFPGVARTLANVRKAGLIPIGTSASAGEQQRLVIEERNGIRMGFLAYTYGTNGIPVPPDKSFAVNIIDREAIKRDIRRLKLEHVDVVTVSLHFGIEYQRLPNEEQTGLARELVKTGADIILGSHPHVVQPYEEIDVAAEDSEDGLARRGIVIYSLGNFISNQTGNWKDVGLIFGVSLAKTSYPDGTSSTEWEAISLEPTWVHILWKNQKRHYTIIPMKHALDKRNIPGLTSKDYAKMSTMLKGINEHLVKLQPK